MSNLRVKTRPIFKPVYPPSLVPERLSEQQTIMPRVIIRRRRRIHAVKPTIHYPESDGMPVAENTVQYENLTDIEGNISILYKDNPNVFIAADLFWYPVEGHPEIKYAPDVMVIFGRPKKDRGSYKQWEEDNIAPQVVFEIWSPGNTKESKKKKFAFYDRYGVEEYYTYDPSQEEIKGWLRINGELREISKMHGWRSLRMGIEFRMERGLNGRKRMQLYYPDGRPFLSRVQEFEKRKAAEAEAKRETAARVEAEAEAERTKALLQAALEQLQKAGISLPDEAS